MLNNTKNQVKQIETKCRKLRSPIKIIQTYHDWVKPTSNFIFRIWMVNEKVLYHSFLIFSCQTFSIQIPGSKRIGQMEINYYSPWNGLLNSQNLTQVFAVRNRPFHHADIINTLDFVECTSIDVSRPSIQSHNTNLSP